MKVYALMLNDMREPNIENIRTVKVADSREELINWYNERFVGEYQIRDGRWCKSFELGSELEWFNPVSWDALLHGDYFGGVMSFEIASIEQMENLKSARVYKR